MIGFRNISPGWRRTGCWRWRRRGCRCYQGFFGWSDRRRRSGGRNVGSRGVRIFGDFYLRRGGRRSSHARLDWLDDRGRLMGDHLRRCTGYRGRLPMSYHRRLMNDRRRSGLVHDGGLFHCLLHNRWRKHRFRREFRGLRWRGLDWLRLRCLGFHGIGDLRRGRHLHRRYFVLRLVLFNRLRGGGCWWHRRHLHGTGSFIWCYVCCVRRRFIVA